MPKAEVVAKLAAPPPQERSAFIEWKLDLERTIAGPKLPPDERLARQNAGLAFDRCYDIPGIMRQRMAIMAQENRKSALASLRKPTLVIHSADDPLVPVEGGKDTAEAIPGAKLMIIERMGHGFLFPEVWPSVMNAIEAHTRSAEA